MKSQYDDNLQHSCVWLVHHASDEKVGHELVGVDVDKPQQQASLGFLDIPS